MPATASSEQNNRNTCTGWKLFPGCHFSRRQAIFVIRYEIPAVEEAFLRLSLQLTAGCICCKIRNTCGRGGLSLVSRLRAAGIPYHSQERNMRPLMNPGGRFKRHNRELQIRLNWCHFSLPLAIFVVRYGIPAVEEACPKFVASDAAGIPYRIKKTSRGRKSSTCCQAGPGSS